MPALSVGLIGYGYAGSTFHAPLIKAVEGLKLAAVVTSKPEDVARDWPEIKVYADVDRLVTDAEIQLVIVTSPNHLHHLHAKAALMAGKHVVVEKPFTLTSEQADDLGKLANSRGLKLSVFHNRRWDNDFLTVKQIIDSGLLGAVHSYEAHFDRYRPQVRDRWREHDLPGAGLLYDLGPHLIDQALVLFGPPETVFADLRRERTHARTIDSFHLVLGYDRLRVILGAGMLVKAQGPRFLLHGDRGSFIKYGCDSQEDALKRGEGPGDPSWGVDSPPLYGTLTAEVAGLPVESRIPTLRGSYEVYYQKVAEAILYDRPPPVLATEARDTIRVIELAEKSQSGGKRSNR